MRNRISPRLHGVIDYITVLTLLISPDLFGMQATASTFTFVLAFVHLGLTMFTDFDAGVLKLIPLRVHGMIEMFVSFGLIGVAIGLGVMGDTVSFYFYLIFSVVLFIAWILTDYKAITASQNWNRSSSE